jgi:hypothetical protein
MSLVLLTACMFNSYSAFSAGEAKIKNFNMDEAYYDNNGLTVIKKKNQELVDSTRWDLTSDSDKHISVYTPKNKDDQTKEVAILRDSTNSEIRAVKTEEKAFMATNEKLQATGLWDSLKNTYDSVVNPGVKLITVYRMGSSIVALDNAGKAEAVNIEMCQSLKKDSKEIFECSKKLASIGKIKPILNPKDLQALRDLSDDPEKEVATSIGALVPKKIWEAYSMCEELERYSSTSSSVATAPTPPVASKENILK